MTFATNLISDVPEAKSFLPLILNLDSDTRQLLSIFVIRSDITIDDRTIPKGIYSFLSHDVGCWGKPNQRDRVMRLVNNLRSEIISQQGEEPDWRPSAGLSVLSEYLKSVDDMTADPEDKQSLHAFSAMSHDTALILMAIANYGERGNLTATTIFTVGDAPGEKSERHAVNVIRCGPAILDDVSHFYNGTIAEYLMSEASNNTSMVSVEDTAEQTSERSADEDKAVALLGDLD